MKDLKTLSDAIRYFSDEMKCIEAVAAMKWPGGKAICPKCGGEEHYWLGTQKRWKCRNGKCGKQFSVKVGTIFEESPISLTKWLPAMWLISNCRNGVSSYEVARAVGVTQKSAWFMMHRIRKALSGEKGVQIGGPDHVVETDETYINGKPMNMHLNKRVEYNRMGKKKAIVMGMLDRDTRQVRATVIRQARREELMNNILAHVGQGSTVHTDEHTGYQHMEFVGDFVHETVTHMKEYVNGAVHTNGIENFWSLLKRGLHGTYVAVEPFHLERYVDEQAFRFNNRIGVSDRQRFEKALSQVAGKRLTYAELTGQVGETAAR
jgi:transposase-like protein